MKTEVRIMKLTKAITMADGFILRGDTAMGRHDFESAAQFYDAALAIVETIRGRRNLAVLDPLLRLVRVNKRLGLDALNTTLLARAQSITYSHAHDSIAGPLH